MIKPLHGTATPKSTHTENASRAESLLNCLLAVFSTTDYAFIAYTVMWFEVSRS